MTQRAIGLQAAGVGGRGLGRKRWGRGGGMWFCVGAVGAEGKRAVGLHWSLLKNFLLTKATRN